MCDRRCYEVGGPWVTTDPECPEHGLESAENERKLLLRIEELEGPRYRVRINTEGGAFYYVGPLYTNKDLAVADASMRSQNTTFEARKELGIVGITVEPFES